jgi:arsenate reductase
VKRERSTGNEEDSHPRALHWQFRPPPDRGELLRYEADERFEVHSAGTQPAPVRNEAVAVIRELGIGISTHRSKPVAEFVGQEFDFVIVVCNRAREECPVFSDAPERLHWLFEDPAAFEQDGEKNASAPFAASGTESIPASWCFLGEGTYGSREAG